MQHILVLQLYYILNTKRNENGDVMDVKDGTGIKLKKTTETIVDLQETEKT